MSKFKKSLDFGFSELPPWRKTEPLTSEMLKDISQCISEYAELPQIAKEFTSVFAKGMAVEFVYHSNVGEYVGTQTFADTKAVLETVLSKGQKEQSCSNGWSKVERESINTLEALTEMMKIKEEMKGTGYLTVDVLLGTHKIVLDGLHGDNGKLRSTQVYASTSEGLHYYPDPSNVEDLIYGVIDHHNNHMKYLEDISGKMTTLDRLKFISKCAAWLLFHFVNTHPFCDGNGRMCRLLGNYVFSLVTPFPVSVYHTNSGRSHRDDYIDAIVKCRKDPDSGPCELAAMLIEGVWHGWRSLFSNLNDPHRPHLMKGQQKLGPVVVNKCDSDDISRKVKRVCEKTNLDTLNVIEEVKRVIGDSKVTSLEYEVMDMPFTDSKGINFVLVVHICP